MYIRKTKDKLDFYVGITERFQGLGFMISFANPIVMNKYLLVEIKFTWFLLWLTYETDTIIKKHKL